MTMNMIQRSATIYQFPTSVRANSNAGRRENSAVVNLRAPNAPRIVYGSGWYHDEAIQDSQRPGKH
ncbi:DUF2735 domain-containing protein [Hansschlegelia plantiphila]|uniref:DUF2735 domain-containing protein n=1 Tax=Hansschlegelia plantiphila TaxID=374655 RepID=A0A9W6MXA0_9HYPH|nr:DUF2735 domain-containing protein [Hansschlegelia plantiphila]GLK69853.1 hypothetical protein GCM10008179_34910 [Hansschlegelia plantiphila]